MISDASFLLIAANKISMGVILLMILHYIIIAQGLLNQCIACGQVKTYKVRPQLFPPTPVQASNNNSGNNKTLTKCASHTYPRIA